jgi:hypothetical protein
VGRESAGRTRARRVPTRYERVAPRWLQRFIDERAVRPIDLGLTADLELGDDLI